MVVPVSPQAVGARDLGQPGARLRLPPTSAQGEGFSLCFKIPFFQIPSSKPLLLGLMLFFSHIPPGFPGLAAARRDGDTLQGASTPASAFAPQQMPKAQGLFPGLSCSLLL